MKLVFLSNYYNHHQRFLSDKLFELCGGEYFFIETSTMREERKKLGYGENFKPHYVIEAFNKEELNRAESIINSADVVIFGSAPFRLVKNRIKNNKLTFKYSERPFKAEESKLSSVFKYPFRFYKIRKENSNSQSLYLLCAGAYSKLDYLSVGLYKNKAFKWGYFPELKKYDVEELITSKDKAKLLWAGRFIDWKHPEFALEVAKRLKEEGYSFNLTFVGTGDMEDELKHKASEYALDDVITFAGAMKPEKVRLQMEKSDIFLFTSNCREGWGAVLNEAMNSGCAVVASCEAGSASYMIKNRYNGLLYDRNDVNKLYESVKLLLDNNELRQKVAENAYKTVNEKWNYEIAAERVILLSNAILNKEACDLFDDGPCSIA